ncbi:ATPase [Parabacteroides sp. OttesenSCG-928-G07]|nr:ATPase [Parabacteroides sp. OttesenSCG-928-G07]
MILIADSGSTKTDWCVAESGEAVRHIPTAGTNPYFQSAEEIQEVIARELLPLTADYAITEVVFYGAGIRFEEQRKVIRDILHRSFKTPVEVDSDLLGAARSLCGDKAGIACILGTGSNSCLYDGRVITENTPPLGFVLGDEGSGAVLGKHLVADCLKGQLPKELIDKFMDRFQLTAELLMDRIYKQPFPNRFLASLVMFLVENIHEEALYQLVHADFTAFFRRNLLQYTGAYSYPVNFTGSVAFYLKDVLCDVAQAEGFQMGIIRKAPMEGLLIYHNS